jgi:hypothetical protein
MSTVMVVMSGDDAARIKQIASDAALLAQDLQQGRSLSDPVAGPLARSIYASLAGLSDRKLAVFVIGGALQYAEPNQFFAQIADAASDLSKCRVPPPGPRASYSPL